MRLIPRNRKIGEFQIGSWSWGHLLEIAGPVIPGFWAKGPRWYMAAHRDRRFKDDHYPEVLGDSGRRFYVRAKEAKHLATIARNYALIQQGLGPEHGDWSNKPDWQRPFPLKIRDDWPPLFLAFADWAEQSRGFTK